uniref:Peroxisomal biogenesis factor 5-like a n=1 Tax=Eptatretus burgeri TaxID=7764 RepID=A0A8C4N6V4_EPTBU
MCKLKLNSDSKDQPPLAKKSSLKSQDPSSLGSSIGTDWTGLGTQTTGRGSAPWSQQQSSSEFSSCWEEGQRMSEQGWQAESDVAGNGRLGSGGSSAMPSPGRQGAPGTPADCWAGDVETGQQVWVAEGTRPLLNQRSDSKTGGRHFVLDDCAPAWCDDEFERTKAAIEADTEFWDKLQAEWEEMALRESSQPWPRAPETFSPPPQWENPYLEQPNAFQEGRRRLLEGDIPSAILLLQAAVTQDPSHVEAWQLLGTALAENEEDPAAICALQRCLDLCPDHLPALLALAVSLTNESCPGQACRALRAWLLAHPSYSTLFPPYCVGSTSNSEPSVAEVRDMFLQACREQKDGEGTDPELQTGLGVLYNLSGEYDQAVEAFSLAVQARLEDHLLWNKLGASLANGNRSSEAVEAYRRALQLRPGYVRSWYNMGISWLNQGAHREAVADLLEALVKQRKNCFQRWQPTAASDNIWAALGLALIGLGRPTLCQAAERRDVDTLIRAFTHH